MNCSRVAARCMQYHRPQSYIASILSHSMQHYPIHYSLSCQAGSQVTFWVHKANNEYISPADEYSECIDARCSGFNN